MRATLVNSIDTTNKNLEKIIRDFGFQIDIKKDNITTILDKTVGDRYGKFLLNKLDRIFFFGNILKALFNEVDINDSESVRDHITM